MGFAGNIVRDRGILAGLLDRLGLPSTLTSPLLAHARAVAEASTRLGLVGPGDVNVVVPRHTADSLLFAAAKPPEPGEAWLDVGSGAGFPGLVLACCYPSTAFTLLEPNRRRAGFLELQGADLGLRNLVVRPERVEEVDGGFDVAVARAFTSPRDALLTLKSQVRVGGSVLVASSAKEQLPAGATAIRVDGFDVVDSPGLLFMMTRGA